MSALRTVSPEPLESPPLESGAPPSPNRSTLYRTVMDALRKTQRYSAYTFSAFALVHMLATTITPAFLPGLANDLLQMGRTIYHAPGVEYILVFGLATLHVFSGVAMRVLRSLRFNPNQHSSSSHSTLLLIVDEPKPGRDRDAVGLGGITLLLGLGYRRLITSRYLGLLPLQFSGYVLVVFLSYHAWAQRLVPLRVDGDLSLVDLLFAGHAVARKGLEVHFALSLLALTLLYHFISGALRYQGIFSKRARKWAYAAIVGITATTAVGLYRLRGVAPGFLATTFDNYLAQKPF